jgi:ubiquinone/menaquinone biosynthesis C-methylase UbiE
MSKQVFEREKNFWNKRTVDLKEEIGYYFDLINTPDRKIYALHKFALDRLGDVSGKKILDLGCGYGALSCYLAKRGAHVTAVDISEESLAISRAWFEKNGVSDRVVTRCGAVEELEWDPNTYDAVVGSFILHHLDLARTMPSVRRLLKKDGHGVFVENNAANPVLMFFRNNVLPRFNLRKGSADEYPFDQKRFSQVRAEFPNSTLFFPEMVFLRLGASYFLKDFGPIRKMLEAVDTLFLKAIPSMAGLSYFSVLEFRKADNT